MPSAMKRLRQFEEENTKLKKVVADLSWTRRCCRTSSAESFGSGNWWIVLVRPAK
jgi:hypothetical protein